MSSMNNAKYRLILPIQAKGNVGKSIEAAARACWLNQRGITWQGFDLDGDNKTLSRLFPGQAKLVPLTGQEDDQDELMSILHKSTAAPVTLVDPRAHLDVQLLAAIRATHFFENAAAQNIGTTIMVFPLDDLDVMTNLDSVCLYCGNQVEDVIVRNPARAPKTRMFNGSELEKDLLSRGAACLTIPRLSEFVKLRLAKLEKDHIRGIAFNEAIGNDELRLDPMARGALQDWLGTMFSQYDRIAAKLLPAAEAAALKPKGPPPISHPPAAVRGARVVLPGSQG